MTKALDQSEIAERKETAMREIDKNPIVEQMMERQTKLSMENDRLHTNLAKLDSERRRLEAENRNLTYLLGHRVFRFFFRD